MVVSAAPEGLDDEEEEVKEEEDDDDDDEEEAAKCTRSESPKAPPSGS